MDAPASTQLELLAPAGDWDTLRAACANGANAVYFGLSQFNARARATNFSLDELPRVMTYLHTRNVRGFVAFNTLIFSDELPQAAEFVAAIARAGVDAVIVQDLGLVRLIRQLAPTLPIHASTQMTLTEPRGIEWVRRLGVERVVLARELSLAEIRQLASKTIMPLEVFVHGALCVAYSGQCLTSEVLGGRSANRGQCAQACRLPYTMLVDGQSRDLGDRAYLLSPQDLAGYDHIAELVAAGVISFKIEGRLKSAAYVALTTQTYRNALDAAAEHRPFHLDNDRRRDLAQVFSRGLTPGFLEGVNHQQLVQGRVPKSRGVRVGVVTHVVRATVRVRLDAPESDSLKPGDGIVLDLGRPEEQEPGGRLFAVRPARQRDEVELFFGHHPPDLRGVRVGCIVWKTDDPALRKRLEASFANDPIVHRRPVDALLSGTLGGPVRLTLTLPAGVSVSVDWPGPLELAHTQALSEADLRRQLDRLGDTPFTLRQLRCELPAGVLLPRSVLNDLRRRAVTRLMERCWPAHPLTAQAAAPATRVIAPAASPAASVSFAAPAAPVAPAAASPAPDAVAEQLRVLVRTLDQLDAVLACAPAGVYCDFEDVRQYRLAVPRARAAGVPIGLATLRILKPGEEGLLAPILNAEPDFVLVRNLGSLAILRERAPQLLLVGDFSLNVANELTAQLLHEAGLVRLVPSYDLNWEQLAAMLGRAEPSWFEVVVHQHMPMFHMEHCVFAAFLSSGKDWRDCGRPCDRHRVELRDRVGAEFPVVPDAGCRNTVFNALPQSAAEFIPRMRQLGVRHYRLDLLRESAAEVAQLVAAYRAVVNGHDDGQALWRQLRALNQLGVTRGTLRLV